MGAPVHQYGPFVATSQTELQDAFDEYRRTQFGGWPWPTTEEVFPGSRDASPDSPTARSSGRGSRRRLATPAPAPGPQVEPNWLPPTSRPPPAGIRPLSEHPRRPTPRARHIRPGYSLAPVRTGTVWGFVGSSRFGVR
ncbi:pirin-like C-terminal cupin domain-containing protein [Corynebacterium suedekumii]|nr:pirin-like C-terminal cupin domain-containing protein [Corynebacterium suedekumii]